MSMLHISVKVGLTDTQIVLTYKNSEYLKEEFDIKWKYLEDKIKNVKEKLSGKIDTKNLMSLMIRLILTK